MENSRKFILLAGVLAAGLVFLFFACNLEADNLCLHDWEESNIILPTCNNDGSMNVYCHLCQVARSKIIKRLGHEINDDPDSWVEKADADCLFGAGTQKNCKRFGTGNCGFFRVDYVTIHALGHDFSTSLGEYTPTFFLNGGELFRCTRCVTTERKPDPAKPADMENYNVELLDNPNSNFDFAYGSTSSWGISDTPARGVTSPAPPGGSGSVMVFGGSNMWQTIWQPRASVPISTNQQYIVSAMVFVEPAINNHQLPYLGIRTSGADSLNGQRAFLPANTPRGEWVLIESPVLTYRNTDSEFILVINGGGATGGVIYYSMIRIFKISEK